MILRLALIAALALTSIPAIAKDVPAEVDKLLACGVIFSLKSDDEKASGDEGAATEWFYRGDELISRGQLSLESSGFSADEISNVVDNTSLIVGFSYGADDQPFTLDECLALSQ